MKLTCVLFAYLLSSFLYFKHRYEIHLRNYCVYVVIMQADDVGGNADYKSQKKFKCIATFLPLKSWRYMIPFQLMTSKVLKQINQSEGVVNYSVKAKFLKKHFWTFSIWMDNKSLRQFVMSEPHATAVKKFTEWAGEGSAFVEWSSQSEMIDWREAFKKLEEPTFYYKKASDETLY